MVQGGIIFDTILFSIHYKKRGIIRKKWGLLNHFPFLSLFSSSFSFRIQLINTYFFLLHPYHFTLVFLVYFFPGVIFQIYLHMDIF